MLEQVLQPLPLFLLVVIALYTIVLVLLLRKTAGATDNTSTSIDKYQRSQNERTLKQYKDKADEAMRLTQTFRKFVPKQFVDHLSKHGSDTLELGRADEDELAILFSDIRGFTGLSEQMSPQELMNFLNSYFLRMNEPIHNNNGF
ncbi:MAG: adenylate/guanylate cyclase domain-containing protein, partial [Paraglaciecola sp.]|nr:adenylate/guanylate cyclase domain-containing protein [Paraglaciecola sp.]